MRYFKILSIETEYWFQNYYLVVNYWYLKSIVYDWSGSYDYVIFFNE